MNTFLFNPKSLALNNIWLSIFLITFQFCFTQEEPFTSKEISINEYIDGTLLTPQSNKKDALVIIIAGSGPTDRNGNQNFLKNNSLKKLAESLSKNNITTFRYDKRIVKQLKQGKIDSTIKFDDFITDAKFVVNYFKKSSNYSNIYILGHSQGSLVGMLSSNKADGFISLSGAGKPIDEVILEQISSKAPIFIEDTKRVLKSLKSGETTTDFPPALASVFNLNVQLFLINWMQYNPQEIIKTLDIPVLIINGTKDLQVSVNQAQLLKKAKKDAKLKIIENMNHVLFDIEGDSADNLNSYNDSSKPINNELVKTIIAFINQ